jgi:hypothetical protein
MLAFIRRLQRFLLPDGSKIFLFATRPDVVSSNPTHSQKPSDTTTRSQPMTTAAAVNASERSPAALFATTMNEGIFAKGKIHTGAHSSQGKT